jgi:hypothetical protein
MSCESCTKSMQQELETCELSQDVLEGRREPIHPRTCVKVVCCRILFLPFPSIGLVQNIQRHEINSTSFRNMDGGHSTDSCNRLTRINEGK